MKKINILGILSILVLAIIVPTLFIIKLIPSDTSYKTVKIANVSIKAEVADTSLKRMEGLIPKKSLPSNQGMLFIFNQEDYHGIWMMNMSFPIDILWINKDLEIVDVAESVPPCKFNCPVYFPNEKALYVLEVNSGFIKKNKIELGNSVSIT